MIRLVLFVVLLPACSLLVAEPEGGSETEDGAEPLTNLLDASGADAELRDLGPSVSPRRWQPEYTQNSKVDLKTVWCAAPDTVFVAGAAGMARSSGDGHWSWMGPRGVRGLHGSGRANVYGFGNGLYHFTGADFAKVSDTIGFNVVTSLNGELWATNGVGVLRGDGMQWQTEFNDVTYQTMAIAFAGEDLFVTSANGAVLHAPKAKNWSIEPVPGAQVLRGVWGASATDVYSVGDKGLFHSAGDGTWTAVLQANLNAIWGASSDDIYAVGKEGLVLHYTKGRGWQPELLDFLTAGMNLLSVHGCSDGSIYVAEEEGVVIHLH